MKIPPKLIGWPIACAVLAMRWTCRVRLHGVDPRPAMRARGEKYVFSILHAQQTAITAFAERGTAAMVSQSADGELLQPIFQVLASARETVRGRDSALAAGVPSLRSSIS
jgi:lysophospholipid acyltransferase (LPLAT)-like uncharacterized protein